MERMTVAIIVAEGFSTFHLSVPLTIFGNKLVDSNLFRLHFCAEESGIIWSKENTAVMAEFDFTWLPKADVIIIPYWNEIRNKPPEALLHALREAQAAEKMIVGLCLGSFVLGWQGSWMGVGLPHTGNMKIYFKRYFQRLCSI